MENEYNSVLEKYIHKDAAKTIAQWIVNSNCNFKITKSRSSKFGDYRPPYGSSGHRISVNHDLNAYAFLITTVHEFAHLKTWNENKQRVKPHGLEWKANFRNLMLPFLEMDIFPIDIQTAVSSYLQNPKASSCSDTDLFRTLNQYNVQKEGLLTVENIPHKSVFFLKNGRAFEKGEKLRKRYRCVEIDTRRVYLFSPLAEVKSEN